MTAGEHHAAFSPGRGHWFFVGTVFFVSGAVSLVYQVLWMKELGRLFGNTAQAAATTLTAFFLGLALGGWYGGKAVSRIANPLRAYGLVEIGIAASALFYFGLLALYGAVYPPLFQALGQVRWVFLLVKFLLGVIVLLPAACLIGATFPVLGHHVARIRTSLGRRGTALYAVNTLGAALGAYLAGFQLPRILGYERSYGAAVAANLVLGGIVIVVSRRIRTTAGVDEPPIPEPAAPAARSAEPAAAPPGTGALPPLSWARVRLLAVLTGFATLALEVLWTHMFAQVLHNSVYTFASILITFLIALAAGSLAAHLLVRRNVSPDKLIPALLVAGSLLVAFTPGLFASLTGGLRYIGENLDWGAYQRRVFTLTVEVIFLPTLLLGSIFPYLLRLAEPYSRSTGKTLGTLVAVNTAGAIVGSLAAGFVLLEVLGLWSSIRFIAVIALAGVVPVAERGPVRGALLRWVPLLGLLLLVPILRIGNPPLVRVGDRGPDEHVVQTWEGSSGIVSVLDGADGLRIKLDNHYTLGGAAVAESERRQGLLPLLLHPDPERVFYLGLGTGITASGAIDSPARQITVCELVPDAITAAREHFGPYTDGLFQDPRVRILPEDGRTFLRATGETFDVIVSDLFIPWEEGSGSLYSLEHFRSVRDHLAPGGIFAQWLPLYQLSRSEFDVIGHTLLRVFPQVTVWRGDFASNGPVMALIARMEPGPVDPDTILSRLSTTKDPAWLIDLDPDLDENLMGLPTFFLAYCGNLTEAHALVDAAPINTDDRPVIEFQAPITQRRAGAHRASMLVGTSLLSFLDDLRAAVPPDRDPYLAPLTPKERGYVTAGYLVQKGRIYRAVDQPDDAQKAADELQQLFISLGGM